MNSKLTRKMITYSGRFFENKKPFVIPNKITYADIYWPSYRQKIVDSQKISQKISHKPRSNK